MSDAFEAATRLQIAALQTVVTDLVTVLADLAPVEVSAFQIATKARPQSTQDETDRQLQAIRLAIYNTGLSR